MADAKRKRARAKHYEAQGGKCYWCGCQMYLPEVYPPEPKKVPKNLCTLDHMLHRFDRGPGIIGAYVAACLSCNEKRGAERLAQEPIERLWERSARPPRAIRLAQK